MDEQFGSEQQQQGEGPGQGNAPGGKFYTFFVDDREFRVDQPIISGSVIMQMAGIPIDIGLILIEEDGTQRQIGPNDEVELKPGRRFKKAPRFKRG